MLRIDHISIHGINGIERLDLSLNKGFNFICGKNGIGKTTILNCIASSFNRVSQEVRKNVRSEEGKWYITGEINDNPRFYEYFNVDENTQYTRTGRPRYKNAIKSKEIINFSISRTAYSTPIYTPKSITQSLTESDRLQNWMYDNYFDVAHMSSKRLKNLLIAQECFYLLNPETRFSKVFRRELKTDENEYKGGPKADIYVETPTGEIPFNYLSSGYRACLSILLGIIKQTEVTSALKDVHSFNGVILIDELDLHLHPAWQAKLIEILKWLVPEAQIIATTHSPHIIQVAKQNEIIALAYHNQKKNEIINQRFIDNEYGLQGWTVEEILQDIMGMGDIYSEKCSEILASFDEALSSFDTEKAGHLFKILDSMLHPNNHLRKILKLQMTSLEKVKYD
ncbi:AAA family ATPase [Priestia aryabhattai]|uniref:AAA family ATPase n=1 Tax=Priestia aryabhattai TaxID=412384 RepID=UPI0027E4B133|nr:AAA family ATPase [Priestia aryabhattai]MCG0050223.1 AAA family ATPase [Priestia aryabhattai]